MLLWVTRMEMQYHLKKKCQFFKVFKARNEKLKKIGILLDNF